MRGRTNYHERHDDGSVTTSLVRASMHGILDSGELQSFFTLWIVQLEAMRVDEGGGGGDTDEETEGAHSTLR